MALNDPQWGRKRAAEDSDQREPEREPERDEERVDRGEAREDGYNERDERACRERDARDNQNDRNPRREKDAGGASDLDELWEDFNKLFGGLLGQRPGRGERPRAVRREDRYDEGNDDRAYEREDDRYAEREEARQEPARAAAGGSRGMHAPRPSAKGAAFAVAAALIAWCASGIYIVPEGQVGVVTTFGRYTQDSAAGINWHMPWPVQAVELVDVSSVRKAEIGIRGSNRLKEALMLTDDENIVDVMFNVQYRIKPHQAKEFLFRSRDPDLSVVNAAESAMREVVGRKAMDSVLFESKQEIAAAVQVAMQGMLDRYQTGIEVMSVAIQNAQPPSQVQAAFNDAVKAGQDRERQINEGQAYANAVVPAAKGLASRLVQEAEGYKARVVDTAAGDAERFGKVFAEYRKAPEVTRDRLYIDAMRDIYANTKKVFVESRSGSNLLYLPFEKLLSEAAKSAAPASAGQSAVEPAPAAASAPAPEADARTLMRMRGR